MLFYKRFYPRKNTAGCERYGRTKNDGGPSQGAQVSLAVGRTGWGACGALGVDMLIESTEQFQASEAIAIRRGPNELTESDYAELTPATRTKLRILQEHGVVRLHAPEDIDALDAAEHEPAKKA